MKQSTARNLICFVGAPEKNGKARASFSDIGFLDKSTPPICRQVQVSRIRTTRVFLCGQFLPNWGSQRLAKVPSRVIHRQNCLLNTRHRPCSTLDLNGGVSHEKPIENGSDFAGFCWSQ